MRAFNAPSCPSSCENALLEREEAENWGNVLNIELAQLSGSLNRWAQCNVRAGTNLTETRWRNDSSKQLAAAGLSNAVAYEIAMYSRVRSARYGSPLSDYFGAWSAACSWYALGTFACGRRSIGFRGWPMHQTYPLLRGSKVELQTQAREFDAIALDIVRLICG